MGTDGTISYSFNSITVNSGGLLELDGDPRANSNYGQGVTVTGTNIIVNSGGRISADSLGFDTRTGPGTGESTGRPGASSYGGQGSISGNGAAGGLTYGSVTAPIHLGSGGMPDSSSDDLNKGGGAVILSVSKTVTVNGTISADGGDGHNSQMSGASGGSVYITTGTLTGSGAIIADGGRGNGSEASGGGGRIAVILTGAGQDFAAFDVSGTLHAYGGDTTREGAAGTVYKQTTAQGTGNGILIIDNNDLVSTAVTSLNDLDASMTVVGSLVMNDQARFSIGSDDELTVGGTLNTLTMDVTGSLTNNGTLSLGGITFTVPGTVDFNNTNNTVVYISQDDNATVTILNEQYYNLYFNNTDTPFNSAADLDVNGSFFIVNGTFSQGVNLDLNVAGNFDIASTGEFTKATNVGTLTFDGDLTYGDNTSPQQDVGRVVVGQSPDTTPLTTDMTATSLKIMATDTMITDGYEIFLTGTMDINGTLDAAPGTDGNTTMHVGGIWDMMGGMFTSTDSTVMFTGTSSALTITSDSKSFNNLITIGDHSICCHNL